MRTDRLKSVRELRQLSQQDLADRVEVSLKQIWRYENGESEPTADTLAKIARELDISADFLLDLSDSPLEQKREDELTAMERRLVQAYRQHAIVEALKVLTVDDSDRE